MVGRHGSFHEVRKQRHCEGSIAMRRAIDHAFFDEPVTYRSNALDFDFEALGDIPRPLRRVTPFCPRLADRPGGNCARADRP